MPKRWNSSIDHQYLASLAVRTTFTYCALLVREAHDLGCPGTRANCDRGPGGPVFGHLDVEAPRVVSGRVGHRHLSSLKLCAEPMFTSKYKPGAWSSSVLNRVL